MILSCNSCEKKFVVPDQAVPQAGRVVQCGSCGNKWKQFPIKQEFKKPVSPKKNYTPKPSIAKISKSQKKKVKKTREIDLYSPEYLEKKHGITLNKNFDKPKLKVKISFGFYNFLLLFLVIIIFISRLIYFSEDFIVQNFPFTEYYLDYFFESLRNMFEIWKSLISRY